MYAFMYVCMYELVLVTMAPYPRYTAVRVGRVHVVDRARCGPPVDAPPDADAPRSTVSLGHGLPAHATRPERLHPCEFMRV